MPFHFVRVDIAGNVSKRFSGSGMRLPRFGNACPRWTLHAAFLTPGVFRARFERRPDGATYFSFARSITRASGGHNAPKSHYAIGLGCAASYADRIVYADGMDGEDPAAAVPIGVSCRLCERVDCAQRAFPPFAPAAKSVPANF